MDSTLLIIIAAIAGIGAGLAIAKMLEKKAAGALLNTAKRDAALILKDAQQEGENIKKDKMLQAKEKFIELKAEHEQGILARDKKVAETEKRIRDKESQISSELSKAKKINDDFEAKTTEYNTKIEVLDRKTQEVEKKCTKAS